MLSFDSKKAQATNYLTVIIVLFLMGFTSLIGYVLTFNIVEGFYNAGFNNATFQAVGNGFLLAVRIFDYVIVLVMVALLIGVGITSYRLNTAPMFFIVTLITGIFTGTVSFFFNYMFIQIAGNSAVQSALVHFPKTMLICTNLHWVALAAIVIGSIALYGKKESSGLVQG